MIQTIYISLLLLIAAYLFLLTIIFYILSKRGSQLNFLWKKILDMLGIEYLEDAQVVSQQGFLDCGAACFETFLKVNKINYDENELFELQNLNGTNFKDLTDAGSNYSLNSNILKFNDDLKFKYRLLESSSSVLVQLDWKFIFLSGNLILLPLYYFLKLFLSKDFLSKINHWVLIEGLTGDNKLIIYDPFLGKIKIKYSTFIESWNHYAIIYN